mmetsp:Transcript_18255/g.26329  ORF Transcript_18255/g.26329 Transcript_18255/m.26329 type:complete len:167 (-) Transcript_18255:297-797(-)
MEATAEEVGLANCSSTVQNSNIGDSTEPMVTLGQQLLKEFAENEKSKNILKRNISRLTTSTIGNQSKLPQVVRNIKGQRTKISRTDYNNDTILKCIAEEEMNDLDLFRSIDELKSCCCRSDSTTNCIKQGFTTTSNGSNKKFDFVALCDYVRKARVTGIRCYPPRG